MSLFFILFLFAGNWVCENAFEDEKWGEAGFFFFFFLSLSGFLINFLILMK